MREFAKGVAQYIVGWVIVRGFIDKLVKHYVRDSDDWEREKKDIAVKVVAEMESIKPGEDLQLHGPAVENIAEKIYAALVGHDSFELWWHSRGGASAPVTRQAFIDACRVGFETVIAGAGAGSHLPGESDEPY